MSKIEVDKVDPQSGTALEIGTSGDTITVPSGVGLTLTNSTLLLPTTVTATTEVKTNKISPATGVAFALGDSGDTFTVPSGATIVNSGTATGFGGGNLELITATTFSSGTPASVDFTSGFSSDYDVYRLDLIQFVPTTEPNYPAVRFSTDGGSSWHSSAGNYLAQIMSIEQGGSIHGGTHTGGYGWFNGVDTQGNQTDEGWSGTFYFYGMNDGNHPFMSGVYNYCDTSGNPIIFTSNVYFTANTDAVDGISLIPDSGGTETWVSGKARFYGIKNS